STAALLACAPQLKRPWGSCYGDPDCDDACARLSSEASVRDCDWMQQQAYDRVASRKDEAPPPRAQGDGGKGEGKITVIEPSSVPVTPERIAAVAMHAIVVIKAGPSLGTGFSVTDRGWIVTNLHVVAGAPDIRVLTGDGKEHKASGVLDFDAEHDLALLHVDGLRAALPIGDSEAVAIGEAVVAIGHPLGLEATVSNGIVSSVREFKQGQQVLQITAPIAPGSSGGPLINTRGQVIGVIQATIRGGQNLNLAVPSRYVVEMLGRAEKAPKAMELSDFATATKGFQDARAAPAAAAVDSGRAAALVSGCSDADKETAAKLIVEAVSAADPLCAQGKNGPCYQLLHGASVDLESKLSGKCMGVKRALVGGRGTAAVLPEPGAQARAIRAVLEGVLGAAKPPAGAAGAAGAAGGR
ncbi:MAG TPA: trypsin-like peptidase domain-containing protein, partial [Candidatus Nanopelagicales bacterium]|nr:trypsin-like peptidase domain-containing protein [Candidatus Nanopelagicales bacterium]